MMSRILVFGMLFVTVLASACSSTYHTQRIDDDDVYYSQTDDREELANESEEYEEYTSSEDKEHQKEQRRETNKAVLRFIGDVFAWGLLLYLWY